MRAVEFLWRQRSTAGSWNYWGSRHWGPQDRKYPDDLDDSALAWACIYRNKPELVSGAALAHFARQLIQCESTPGGPYTTWLTTSRAQAWHDVDVAVNANIGYVLNLLGVKLAPLNVYIDQQLSAGRLKSQYYVGEAPVIYFLARWYRGEQLSQLRDLIMYHLAQAKSSLTLALLITAACNVGLRRQIPERCLEALCKPERSGVWPAEPLYFEPPTHGQQSFAMSSALTTAFAVEAIHAWLQLRNQDLHEIRDMATIVARAGGWSISEATITLLNLGSVQGWQAYGLYDDILDGDKSLSLLPQTLGALRATWHTFSSVLPRNQDYQEYVRTTFARMDAALNWEMTNARDARKLPNYEDLTVLADKSWGHALAAVGVLVAAGYAVDSPEVHAIEQFFRHYLIARQLCDDARDRDTDLRQSRITPAVAWRSSVRLDYHIRDNLERARAILHNVDFLCDTTIFVAWLDRLDVKHQARNRDRQFVNEFYGSG